VSTIVTDPVEEDFATASTCVETPTAVNDRGAEVTILEAVPSGLWPFAESALVKIVSSKTTSCEVPGKYAENGSMPVDRVVSILNNADVERSIAGFEDDLRCEPGTLTAVMVVCRGTMGAWTASIDTGCWPCVDAQETTLAGCASIDEFGESLCFEPRKDLPLSSVFWYAPDVVVCTTVAAPSCPDANCSALNFWLESSTLLSVDGSDICVWVEGSDGDPNDSFEAAGEPTAVGWMPLTDKSTLEGCSRNNDDGFEGFICVEVFGASVPSELSRFVLNESVWTGSEETVISWYLSAERPRFDPRSGMSKMLSVGATVLGCAEMICFDSDDRFGAASMPTTAALLVSGLMSRATLDMKEAALRLMVGFDVVNDSPILLLLVDGESKFAGFGSLVAWEAGDVAVVPAEDVDLGNSTELYCVANRSPICTDGVIGGRLRAWLVDCTPRFDSSDGPDTWAGNAVAAAGRSDDTSMNRLIKSGIFVAGDVSSLCGEAVGRRLSNNALGGGAYTAAVPDTETCEGAIRDALECGLKEMEMDWSKACMLEADTVGRETLGDSALELGDPAVADSGWFDFGASFRNSFIRCCNLSQVSGRKSCPLGHVSLTR
jgi:hypothetical protein